MAAGKAGKPYTGVELYQELLKTYHLQMEMMTPAYVLGILTCMDKAEGLRRLKKALFEIDSQLAPLEAAEKREERRQDNRYPVIKETIEAALSKEAEFILPQLAEGRESADYINLYPPGIPLIVPGEVISRDLVDRLLVYSKQDLPLQGLAEGRIAVVQDKAKVKS